MQTIAPVSEIGNNNILNHKPTWKKDLQASLDWPEEERAPILCLPLGMSEELGGELLRCLLPGIFSLPLSLLVRGKGSTEFGKLFTELSEKKNHRLEIVGNRREDIEQMIAGSDMALFLSAPAAGCTELKMCLKAGVVPISLPSSVLETYDPVQETGNAFIIEHPTVWDTYAAIVRALETYRFPFDWKTIQKHCVRSVA